MCVCGLVSRVAGNYDVSKACRRIRLIRKLCAPHLRPPSQRASVACNSALRPAPPACLSCAGVVRPESPPAGREGPCASRARCRRRACRGHARRAWASTRVGDAARLYGGPADFARGEIASVSSTFWQMCDIALARLSRAEQVLTQACMHACMSACVHALDLYVRAEHRHRTSTEWVMRSPRRWDLQASENVMCGIFCAGNDVGRCGGTVFDALVEVCAIHDISVPHAHAVCVCVCVDPVTIWHSRFPV